LQMDFHKVVTVAELEAQIRDEKNATNKAKEENQVLLQKLQEVILRYRQLQQQHQQIESAVSGDTSDLWNQLNLKSDAIKQLESEKMELISKLKSVIGKCRMLQKQIQDGATTGSTDDRESSDKPVNNKASNEMIQHLTKKVEELTDQLHRLEMDLAAEKQKSHSMSNTLSPEHEEMVKSLQENLIVKENEKQDVATKLQDVIARYRKLQQHAQDVQSTCDIATKRSQELEKILHEKDSDTTLHQELEKLQNAIRDTESRLASTESENNSLQSVINEKQLQLDEMTRAQETLEIKVQTIDQLNTQMESSMSKLQDIHVQTHNDINSKLSMELESTKSHLQSIEQELNLAKTQQHTTQQQYSDEIKRMESDHLAEYSTLRERIIGLEQAIVEKDGYLSSLQEAEKTAREHLHNSQANQSDAESTLLSRIEEYERKCTNILAEKNAVQEQLDDSSTRLEKMKQSMDEIVASQKYNIHEHEKCQEELSIQVSDLQETVRKFELDLETRTKSHEEERLLLSTKIDELEQAIIEKDGYLSSLQEAEKTAREHLHSSQADRSDAESTLLSRIEEYERKYTDILAEKAMIKEQLDGSLMKVEDCYKKIGDLEEHLDVKDGITNTLKEKLEEVLKRYKKLQEQAIELKSKYDENATELDQLKRGVVQSSELQLTIENLENKLKCAVEAELSLTEKLEKELLDKGNLENEKALLGSTHSDQVNKMKECIDVKEESIAKLTGTIEDLQTKCNDYCNEIAKKELDQKELLEQLESRNARLQSALDDKESAILTMNQTISSLKNQVDEAQNAQNNLVDKSSETEAEFQTQIAEKMAQLCVIEEQVNILQIDKENLGNQVTTLQDEITTVRAELAVEIEAAGEARVALEHYKKRAHSALKKASTEGKLYEKKFIEDKIALEIDVERLRAEVTRLESEISNEKSNSEQLRKRYDEELRKVKIDYDETQQNLNNLLIDHKHQLELSIQKVAELDQSKTMLDEMYRHAQEREEKLVNEMENLRKEIQSKSDIARQMLKVKDAEIGELMKRLETQAQSSTATIPDQATLDDHSEATTIRSSVTSAPTALQHEHIRQASGDSLRINAIENYSGSTTQTVMNAFHDPVSVVDGQILKLARVRTFIFGYTLQLSYIYRMTRSKHCVMKNCKCCENKTWS